MDTSRDFDPRAALVAGACLYETIAIVTGIVPTITSLAWSARRTWLGRATIWLAGGYVFWHLLMEEAQQ